MRKSGIMSKLAFLTRSGDLKTYPFVLGNDLGVESGLAVILVNAEDIRLG